MAVVVEVETVVVLAVVRVEDDVSDTARSLFPAEFRISRYGNVATRPGTVVPSRRPERCRLEECDLYRDLTMFSLMRRRVSVYVYILYPLVVDPTVGDRQSPVS